jgi:hypothetical protein
MIDSNINENKDFIHKNNKSKKKIIEPKNKKIIITEKKENINDPIKDISPLQSNNENNDKDKMSTEKKETKEIKEQNKLEEKETKETKENKNNKNTDNKPKEKTQEITKEEKFNNLNQLCKYKRFKIFLRNFINEEEEKFFKNLTEKEKIQIETKLKDIKDFLKNSKNLNKNKLPENFIETLKEFSYTNFGFIKNEERLKILKILFLIEDQPKEKIKKTISIIQTINKKGDLYVKKFKEIYSIVEFQDKEKEINNINNINKNKINLFYNKKNNHYYKSNISSQLNNDNYNGNNNENNNENNNNINPNLKYSNIIDLDVRRTIFNSIFYGNEDMDIMLNFLKKQVANKIKIFFSLFPEFSYYQGFHDIAIYFYILILQDKDIEKDYFDTEENDDIFFYEVLQRMSEFYLKDYLTDYDIGYKEDINDIKNENKNSLIPSISPSPSSPSFPSFSFKFDVVYKIISDIIKLEDNIIYEIIQEKSDFPDPIYSLPWILTFFTQDIKSINKLFRIYDYLLMEHPLGIYFLSSNVNK